MECLSSEETRLFAKKAFSAFRYVAKYRFEDGSLAPDIQGVVKTQYATYYLPLHEAYPSILRSYSVNRKRNLRKGRQYDQRVVANTDIGPLLRMFELYTIPRVASSLRWEATMLLSVFQCAQARKMAELYYTVDASGELLAGGLYLFYKNRIVYLFGSATDQGLRHQSMTLLMDHLIRKYGGTSYTLDFEGGNTPGLAQFYSSFGAYPVYFSEVQMLRIPFLLRRLNKIRRRIQLKGTGLAKSLVNRV